MLNNFISYMRYERQAAPVTVARYSALVNEFKKFFGKDLEITTKEDIGSFLEFLTKRGLEKSTIANYITALRVFLRWAAYIKKTDNLYTAHYFLTNIVKCRRENKIPFVPTRDELIQLRHFIKTYLNLISYDISTPTYRKTMRVYAIIELLTTSGMRAGEVCNLRFQDIDLTSKMVFIRHGKNNYQRYSIFGESAHKAFEEYLALYKFAPDELVFPIQRGTLSVLIKKWAKRARIDQRIHAHSFRHYFITESHKQGISNEEIAVQVGHRNINSTKHYTHLDMEYLKTRFSSAVY